MPKGQKGKNMSINSIINSVKYSEELDKMFAQKSVTGFFADNNLAAKFVGAKTVIIPDINFQGLADYDRNSGYSRGAITVSNTSHTMQMDRARSLQIDREDMDESGIANLAGKILGEYVRTKVVPECDAYVLSKMASIAKDRGNLVDGNINMPIITLSAMISEVQSNVGYDEELVAFVNSNVYAAIQRSSEVNPMVVISDFKQGDLNLKVNTINGVAILPVVKERMKTKFNFKDDEIGGFTPADDAEDIYMLVCPKKSVHLVKKTENMRIFTPEQNLDADAYKFDYRIYYDAFVNKSGLDSIFAWISYPIEFRQQPESVTVTEGNISASLEADAFTYGTLNYVWYSCEDEFGNGAKKVASGVEAIYELPADLEAGKYYYFVRAVVDGAGYKDSDIAVVTVN